MSSTPVILLAAALWCSACAPVINKTPVSGVQTDVVRLVGDWQGDYNSVESGRRGLITFRLRAGADTAEGDVIMQSRNEADPSAPDASVVPWDALRATQQALSIHFVFVTVDEVSGVLNPYRDPDCGCTLTTTFLGKLRGDVIEGTYRTEGTGIGHNPQTGQWRVKRFTP